MFETASLSTFTPLLPSAIIGNGLKKGLELQGSVTPLSPQVIPKSLSRFSLLFISVLLSASLYSL